MQSLGCYDHFFSDSFSILVRLHAKEKQKASGWTGFNISVCNEFQVLHYVIGYSRWWCGREWALISLLQ